MKKIKSVLLIATLFFAGCIYSQNKQSKMDNREVVKTFLNGFNDPSKIQESLALLAEDYRFTNPMVQLSSKAEFIALSQEMGKVLTGVRIINLVGDEEWIAAYYEFSSSIPSLEKNYATEWFSIKDGIIKESILIYDASEWRKVYAQMDN